MSKTIAVAMPRGGSGRTTTAVTLATAAGDYGHRALLVDLDPQAQCSASLGVDRGSGLYAVVWDGEPLSNHIIRARPGCDLLTGGSGARFNRMLVLHPPALRSLAEALKRYAGGYDCVILDCPPSYTRLTIAALLAADWILIPVWCTYQGIASFNQFTGYLGDLQEHPDGPIGKVIAIIPTFYDSRAWDIKETLGELMDRVSDYIPAIIPRATAVEAAPAYGMTVWEHCPKSKAAAAYRKLADWLFIRWI